MDATTFKELKERCYWSARILRDFFCDLEDEANDRIQRILNPSDPDSRVNSTQALAILRHIEMEYQLELRYAILPRVMGLLERTTKQICRLEYPVESQSIQQSGWLKSCMQLLKRKGFNTTSIQRELNLCHDLIVLRNCVTHADGEVSATGNPARVRLAINNLAKLDATKETRELDDGYLFLGGDVISTAMQTVLDILRLVLKHFGHDLGYGLWIEPGSGTQSVGCVE